MDSKSFLSPELINHDTIVEFIKSSKKLRDAGVLVGNTSNAECIHLNQGNQEDGLLRGNLKTHEMHINLLAYGLDPYCCLGWSAEEGRAAQSQYDSQLLDFLCWMNDAMIGSKIYLYGVGESQLGIYPSGYKYFLCKEITTTHGLLTKNLEEDILVFFDDLRLFWANFPSDIV